MPRPSKRKLHTRNLVNSKERNSNGTFGIKKTKELNDSSVEALKHGDNDIICEEKDIKQIESDDSLIKILDDESKDYCFFQSKESENLPEFLKNELTDGKNNMAFSEYKINSSLEAAQIVFIDPAPLSNMVTMILSVKKKT
ncbi:13744_t:CDS:2 [Entrophospora sp. SA101]|nr:13744_t:CDS:2 [Entrophospora sp. SA101]